MFILYAERDHADQDIRLMAVCNTLADCTEAYNTLDEQDEWPEGFDAIARCKNATNSDQSGITWVDQGTDWLLDQNDEWKLISDVRG